MTALATQGTQAPTAKPAPRRAPNDPAELTPVERAAVVLSLLPSDQARALAERLESGSVQRVIDAYEAMGSLPRPVTLSIVARFVSELKVADQTVRGGARQAARLASAIVPPAPAEPEDEADQSSLEPGAPPEAVWAHLSGLDPAVLATTLSNERAAVVAIVLSRLSEEKGGKLLAALPEELAICVVRHAAGGRTASEDTAGAVAEALRARAAESPVTAAPTDETAALTALLNRCPLSRQEAVLAPLRGEAPETATKIEAGLLRFDTLAERLPRTAAPILFREAEASVLDVALRYGEKASPAATDYLYANISQRLAEQIRERVAAIPAPSEEEGEEAQATIIGTLLEWVEDGRFALTEPERGRD